MGSRRGGFAWNQDFALRNEIDRRISQGEFPACCQTRGGFVGDLSPTAFIDTFIYIDVLEHIEQDRSELETAAARVSAGGHLIVLSPAFQFLYSPFDRSIGHYRRYDKKMFQALTPAHCRIKKLIYLDLVGMTTSLVNRFLLSQSMPTVEQIKFWDTYLVPISKVMDRILGYRFGRSILCIWGKE